MGKKVTIADIAKLAEVSKTTVSFVLSGNNSAKIASNTRQKIFNIADSLGYSYTTRSKKQTKPAKTIGVIVPTLNNPIYSNWLKEIQKNTQKCGYNIIIANTFRNTKLETTSFNMLLDRKVDGIIVVFNPHISSHANFWGDKIPLVHLADKDSMTSVDTVGLDSFKAGGIITDHLLNLGHKHIAYISTPLSGISISRANRLKGIKRRLADNGLVDNLVIETEHYETESLLGDYEIEIGYKFTKKIIQERNNITGIIGVNDMVAIGAINAIKDMNMSVPDDMSVCGFDNIYFSTQIRPTLTTIDHHLAHRAKHAVDILMDRINNNHNGNVDTDIVKVEYEPKLIKRESTAEVKNL